MSGSGPDVLPSLRDTTQAGDPDLSTPGAALNLARTLRAIAPPARLQILWLVASRRGQWVTPTDVQDALGLKQPEVSVHCAILVDANLLVREKRGRRAFYVIEPRSSALVDAILALARTTEALPPTS